MSKLKSQRADGRGHWRRGRRRNPDGGNWGRTRLALRRFIDAYYRLGSISYRALARDLGVTDRSVRKWIRGVNRPDIQTQEAIEAWMEEMRPPNK